MRVLKFRAWSKIEKQFVDDFVIDCLGNEYQYNKCEFWGDDRDVILMQYTELKDRNGVEIFEGDIVKGLAEHKGQSNVFYGYGQWQPFAYLSTHNGDDFEVIGNIYEHPHLLNEGAK